MPDIDPTTSALVLYILTSSIVAPLVSMLINRPQWSRGVRQGIAALVAIIVAIGVLILTGGFESLAQGATTVLLVLGLSTVAYETIWKPTGVATKVETATSPQILEEPYGGTAAREHV